MSGTWYLCDLQRLRSPTPAPAFLLPFLMPLQLNMFQQAVRPSTGRCATRVLRTQHPHYAQLELFYFRLYLTWCCRPNSCLWLTHNRHVSQTQLSFSFHAEETLRSPRMLHNVNQSTLRSGNSPHKCVPKPNWTATEDLPRVQRWRLQKSNPPLPSQSQC